MYVYELSRFDVRLSLFIVVTIVIVTYCYAIVNVCWTQAAVMPQQACGSQRTVLWSSIFFMFTWFPERRPSSPGLLSTHLASPCPFFPQSVCVLLLNSAYYLFVR